jgi:acetyltransferase-like isoleucine patch superfamily enzyme
VGAGCRIAPGSTIRAREVVLGEHVEIEAGVRVSADRIELGDGCRIGRDVSIVSPDVQIGSGSQIGEGGSFELNEYLRIGSVSDVGRRLRVTGQGMQAGDHLWVTDDVTVGGGGARGPRSYLTIGNRCAMMDRCFINVAEPVAIGDEVAFSNNVTVLTHSMWQPVLEGGTSKFAPVQIGSHVILYVNAVIAPGVTIGSHVTIGAAALVLRDVPDGSMAVGNPARILRVAPAFPRRLPAERRHAMVRELLREYAASVGMKAARVAAQSDDRLEVVVDGVREIIEYRPTEAIVKVGDITFDLTLRTMNGGSTPVAEDFRDFLRRRSIRIFTNRPFQSLPLANIARLKARLTLEQ